MLPAWTMAPLASNAQNKISLIVAIPERRGSDRLKVGRMTFDAAGNHRPVEICRAVQISWTVDPAAEFHPIRNGEFEKLVSLPIQICLALSSGAYYQAKGFRPFLAAGRLSEDRGLIKAAVHDIHSERKAGVDRFQGVSWRRKFSGDGVSAWHLGSAVVHRLLERLQLVLMAGATRFVPDVAGSAPFAGRCLRNRFIGRRTRWRQLWPSVSRTNSDRQSQKEDNISSCHSIPLRKRLLEPTLAP